MEEIRDVLELYKPISLCHGEEYIMSSLECGEWEMVFYGGVMNLLEYEVKNIDWKDIKDLCEYCELNSYMFSSSEWDEICSLSYKYERRDD